MKAEKTVERLWHRGLWRIVNRGDYRLVGTRKVRELRLERRQPGSSVWCLEAGAEFLGWPQCGYNSRSQAFAYLKNLTARR